MTAALAALDRILMSLETGADIAPEDARWLAVALRSVLRGDAVAKAFRLPRNFRQRARIAARDAALRQAARELEADAESLRSQLLRRSASANRPDDTLGDVLDSEDGVVRSIPTIRRALRQAVP